MKTVTVEQFKNFGPCWLETAEGREKFARIAAIRNEWTALDVLNLPDVSAQDKLWSVLREEFIDAPILHEFACRCAEYALSFVESPDPRSIAAIEAKRKWLRGEITGAELYDACAAATAAARGTAWDFAWDAACAAATAAAQDAAQDAAWDFAWDAACAAAQVAATAAAMAAAQAVTRDYARDAASAAAWAAAQAAAQAAAWDAASDAAREHEVEMLRELLEEGGKQ